MAQNNQTKAKSPASSTRKVVRAFIILILALAAIYDVRVLWLFMAASEGDVPPASAVPLPEGARILSESRDCASGGCWITVEVQPAPGQTAEALASEIGATPQREIPGNFLDPRSIWVSARPSGEVLSLQIDYWSQKWVP